MNKQEHCEYNEEDCLNSGNWVKRGMLFFGEDKITWICILNMYIGFGTMLVSIHVGSNWFILGGFLTTIVFSVVFLFHLHHQISLSEKEMVR